MNNEIGYLTDEILKQIVGGMAWISLTAYRKMQEEREKLKELLSKKEAELEDLENYHPVHKAKKMEEHVLEGT